MACTDPEEPPLLTGHGPMAAHVLSHDWSATPLGPISQWPQSLLVPVQLLLQSRQPMYLAWGAELTSIYNDGYIDILGDKHPAGLGRPFRHLWAEVAADFEPMLASVWAGLSHYAKDVPVALQGRPGKPMSWFTYSWTPLYDDNRQVQGFLCVATETTARVLESTKLAKVMSLLEDIEAATVTGSWEIDLASGQMVSSEGMLRLHGLDPAGPAPTAEEWRNFLHPDEAELKATPLDQLIGPAAHLLNEYRVVTPQQETRWLSTTLKVVRDPNGSGTTVRGITADVSEHKSLKMGQNRLLRLVHENQNMARALQAQKQRLDVALEAAGLGLWEFNTQTQSFYADPRLCAILGEAAETYRPSFQGWAERIHPDDASATLKAFGDHMSGLTPSYGMEYLMRHADGHWIWVVATGRIVSRDPDGTPLLVAGTAQDITARKKQTEQSMDLLLQIKSLIQDITQQPSQGQVQTGSSTGLDELTKRQRQLLGLIAQGWTTARIAAELKISPATATSHRRDLMRKLKLHNTAELTTFAIRHGVVRGV